MNPPPFLLGATLLFWGWQTGLLLPAVLMAIVLESARFIEARWEFSDADLSRIWTFCSILFLATIVYAFSANDGISNFTGLFQDPSITAQRRVGDTSSKTAVAAVRWSPMVLFLFVAAQTFSTRTALPLATISLIFRRRLKRARGKRGPPPSIGTGPVLNSYFALCLCAASADTTRYATFFTGFAALLIWALWPHRSRRFSPLLWAGMVGIVLVVGYGGQRGIIELQRLVNNYNPQWFSGFPQRGFDPDRTQTALGQIGELKLSGKIVIRLKTANGQAPPGLLREASYREYHSLSWVAGEASGSFQYLAVGNDGTTWNLQRVMSHLKSVNIACSLPGQHALLPLPHGSATLEHMPDFVILSRNDNGAVLAEQSGLVIFDAGYGNAQTMDAAADTSTDLQVPLRERPALERVITEFGLGGQSLDDKLHSLREFFAAHFTYSLWQRPPPPVGTNATPLARFLLDTHSGHCEYFATATVLLLRMLDVPARYAVGYAVHEGANGKYVVRQRDAHAWCQVWNQDRGTWEDFDTTPASWIQAEGKRASMFEWLSDVWSWIKFEIAKVRWGQTHIRRYVLLALIPVLGFLLYRIVFRRRQLRRKPGGTATQPRAWPGLDSEFYLVERRLEQLGFERRPGETIMRWLERITETQEAAGLREILCALSREHYRLRFDPFGVPAEARAALRNQALACLGDLERLRTRPAGA